MGSHKNKLEMVVADALTDIYKYCRPTIASGATPIESGDIKTPWFLIECKIKRTSKAFTIPYAEWYKCCGEADREYKDPVFIVENELGEKVATMRFLEWVDLIKELMELRTLLDDKTGEKK